MVEIDVKSQPSISTGIRKRVSLWFEFLNPNMCELCRMKEKRHFTCKPVLDLKWTLIVTRAANIQLLGTVKFTDNQFPVVSASMITIHILQYGKFEEVYYNYKSELTLRSVVTSVIQSVSLTKNRDNFKIYHGQGRMASTLKQYAVSTSGRPNIGCPRGQVRQEIFANEKSAFNG